MALLHRGKDPTTPLKKYLFSIFGDDLRGLGEALEVLLKDFWAGCWDMFARFSDGFCDVFGQS